MNFIEHEPVVINDVRYQAVRETGHTKPACLRCVAAYADGTPRPLCIRLKNAIPGSCGGLTYWLPFSQVAALRLTGKIDSLTKNGKR